MIELLHALVVLFVLYGGMFLLFRFMFKAYKRLFWVSIKEEIEGPRNVNYRMIGFKLKSELIPIAKDSGTVRKEK